MPNQPQALVTYAAQMQVHMAIRGSKVQYLADLNTVEIKTANGAQPVFTFGADNQRGGLAGNSAGPVTNMVTFQSAHRVDGGGDVDWLDIIQEAKKLTLYFYYRGDTSGQRWRLEGFPQSLDQKAQLASPSADSIVIMCGRATKAR